MFLAKNVFVLLFFYQIIAILNGMEGGFTFKLGPRTRECFYEDLKANMSLDLEYQVIDGGDLDINFEVTDPNGRQLIFAEKTSDDAHEVNIKIDGVYRFCLDNSFSAMTTKVVYLDLGVERDEEFMEEESHIDSMLKVYANIESIHFKLDKMSSYQSSVRAKEARQRYFLEGNHFRVMWLSSVASIVMIIVGLVQVYFVRHLFDTRSKTRI